MSDSFTVEWLPQARKQLSRIDIVQQRRLILASQALATNPFPPKSSKIVAPYDLYRVRVGNYRIVYSVDGEKLLVLIVTTGHRREIYKKLSQ